MDYTRLIGRSNVAYVEGVVSVAAVIHFREHYNMNSGTNILRTFPTTCRVWSCAMASCGRRPVGPMHPNGQPGPDVSAKQAGSLLLHFICSVIEPVVRRFTSRLLLYSICAVLRNAHDSVAGNGVHDNLSALFVCHLQSDLPDRDARQNALAEVKGYLSAGRPSGVRSLSAGSGHAGQANGQPTDSAKTRASSIWSITLMLNSYPSINCGTGFSAKVLP